ncbi:MAG: ABC transporter permease [Phycisphaeraceae bacterium]|nr:ABC transporter permease [Phycisphaeraceae bacterium]
MDAVWAIASKDMRLLLRDRMGFFFAFFFPLIVAVFFGVIFSGGGGRTARIDVVVADLDGTDDSRALVQQLADDPQLAVEVVADREPAVARVRAGKSTAVIVIPEGFGGKQSGLFFSMGAEVELGVDPARFAERGMLEGLLIKHGFMRMQQSFRRPALAREELKLSRDRLQRTEGIGPVQRLALNRLFDDIEAFLAVLPEQVELDPPDDGPEGPQAASEDRGHADLQSGIAAWQPMRIRSIDATQRQSADGQYGPRPPSSFAITFPQGIIWGVMGCALGFSIAMVGERTHGTLLRLRVAPITPWQILAGKSLACFLTTLAVAVFLIAIGAAVFDVRPTSWPILAVAVVCTGLCFVGIMMLLAVLSPSERSGNGLGWGVLLMLSMIGGGMLPLFFMPGWMRTLSVISPIRWSILAIEGGLWRNSNWGELVLPCAILLAIGAAGLLAGAHLLRRQESA